MRRASASALLLRRSPASLTPLHHHLFKPLSTSSLPPPPLSDKDLAEINTLIPNLCDSGHHLTAVQLLSTALLTNPSLSSLPLPSLAARLAAHPDLAPTMALLTALRHNPRRPSPLPFCSLLLSSYLANRRLKESAKIFSWLCRPDSPCRPDAEVYGIVILGFCRHGRALEAVRVMREMVRDGASPGMEMREAVYRCLLREARVDEARELDAVLGRWGEDGDGVRGAAELLDRMIREWEE